jgi:tRNA 5-methylaminomethyl-2-thiouridine biosynthesis bifunctional protein
VTDHSPILFDPDGPPRSRLYDDLYYSRDDGLAETRAVFLAGCGLPQRWQGRRRFTVAELGFGTGLNVLALLDLWRAARPAGGHLSIFSVEAHPIGAAEAAAALAAWPELADLAARITSRWPGRRPGFHRIDLPELAATLDVAVMPASDALAAWSGPADAWFLDGFAPAKNPAMWTDALMRQVAERSAPGALAATYTVAGQVRRALGLAGFTVERRAGFGRKRERLVATLPGESKSPEAPTVAIVGAGIAGASLARAFASLGVTADVFEAAGVGAGASGNPAAVVTPRLDAGLGPGAQLYVQAFERAVRLYGELQGAVITRGALQLRIEERDTARFAKIAASDLFEPGSLAELDANAAGAALGEPAPPALRFDAAVVIEPHRVLDAWLPQPTLASIAAVRPDRQGWALLDADGQPLAHADIVCLAAGAGVAALWPDAPLTPVRGQVSWAEGVAPPPAVSWGGYAATTPGGAMFGATHDRGDASDGWRLEDDRRNLAEVAGRLPVLAARLAAADIRGRASVRATVPDNLPLAGPLADKLFVLGALGGRGFTLAPLLAEHIAALALGAPSPLPAPVAALLNPGRFSERERRRERLAARPTTV